MRLQSRAFFLVHDVQNPFALALALVVAYADAYAVHARAEISLPQVIENKMVPVQEP